MRVLRRWWDDPVYHAFTWAAELAIIGVVTVLITVAALRWLS